MINNKSKILIMNSILFLVYCLSYILFGHAMSSFLVSSLYPIIFYSFYFLRSEFDKKMGLLLFFLNSYLYLTLHCFICCVLYRFFNPSLDYGHILEFESSIEYIFSGLWSMISISLFCLLIYGLWFYKKTRETKINKSFAFEKGTCLVISLFYQVLFLVADMIVLCDIDSPEVSPLVLIVIVLPLVLSCFYFNSEFNKSVALDLVVLTCFLPIIWGIFDVSITMYCDASGAYFYTEGIQEVRTCLLIIRILWIVTGALTFVTMGIVRKIVREIKHAVRRISQKNKNDN